MYERGGDDGVCLERGRKISAKGKWKGGKWGKRKRKGSANLNKTQCNMDLEKYENELINDYC